jgi:NAD(P)-dependent dehydrogenase (short-subunit alcohol dehydrogenase family)
MDLQLGNKLAFVSAGAHGIGRATADLLTAEGASVIVADQDATALQENGGGWKGTVSADLSTAAGVDDAVAYVLLTFGRAPDILINNLGVGNSTPFEEIDDDRWERSFNTNLMGSVRLCRALLPMMKEQGGGAVVITGSDLSKQPEPGFMDYGSFKAGLLYVAKALAKE